MEELYLVSDNLKSISAAEFDAAEEMLGCVFPASFRSFMCQYGEGSISGYIRPYHPKKIVKDRRYCAEVLSDDHLVSLGMTSDESKELVVVANTILGDEFYFHPSNPQMYYVFPRHQWDAFEVEGSFHDLIDWIAGGDEIVQPFESRFYQPWNDHSTLRFSDDSPKLPITEVKELFSAIGVADYCLEDEECIDYFLKPYGAHLQYRLVPDRDYLSFIVCFDQDDDQRFLRAFADVFNGRGFQLSESYNVSGKCLRILE